MGDESMMEIEENEWEDKKVKENFLASVFAVLATGLVISLYVIIYFFGFDRDACLAFYAEDCPWRVSIFFVCLILLKIFCWELCFPSPLFHFILKYYPIPYGFAMILVGSYVMAYIATVIQNWSNLFTILLLTFIVTLAVYGTPLMSSNISEKEWLILVRSGNIYITTFVSVIIIVLFWIPILKVVTGHNKVFYITTFAAYCTVCVFEILQTFLFYLAFTKENRIEDSFVTSALMIFGTYVFVYTFFIFCHPVYFVRWWKNT